MLDDLISALGSILLLDSKPLFNLLSETFAQDGCESLFESVFTEFGAAEGSVMCNTCDVTFSNHPPLTWSSDILATAQCTVANGGPSGTFYIGKKRLTYFLAAFDWSYLLALFDVAGRFSGTVGFGAVGSFIKAGGTTTTTCEILMQAENVGNLDRSGRSAKAGVFQPLAKFRPIPVVFSNERGSSGPFSSTRRAKPACKVSNGVDCTFSAVSGIGFNTELIFDCDGEPLVINPYMIPSTPN